MSQDIVVPQLDTYHLSVHLLNLRDQNLPPFKDARTRRIQSTKRIINMINNCARTAPVIPSLIFSLDKNDPEWDDDMIYPRINHGKFLVRNVLGVAALGWYAYNWPLFTFNQRFRFVRYAFPMIAACAFYANFK